MLSLVGIELPARKTQACSCRVAKAPSKANARFLFSFATREPIRNTSNIPLHATRPMVRPSKARQNREGWGQSLTQADEADHEKCNVQLNSTTYRRWKPQNPPPPSSQTKNATEVLLVPPVYKSRDVLARRRRGIQARAPLLSFKGESFMIGAGNSFNDGLDRSLRNRVVQQRN